GGDPIPGLAPAPVRGALLVEGGGALDRVLGGERRADDLALLSPEGLVVPGPLAVEDGLRGPERERCVRGHLLSELQRRPERISLLRGPVDQAELGRPRWRQARALRPGYRAWRPSPRRSGRRRARSRARLRPRSPRSQRSAASPPASGRSRRSHDRRPRAARRWRTPSGPCPS